MAVIISENGRIEVKFRETKSGRGQTISFGKGTDAYNKAKEFDNKIKEEKKLVKLKQRLVRYETILDDTNRQISDIKSQFLEDFKNKVKVMLDNGVPMDVIVNYIFVTLQIEIRFNDIRNFIEELERNGEEETTE